MERVGLVPRQLALGGGSPKVGYDAGKSFVDGGGPSLFSTSVAFSRDGALFAGSRDCSVPGQGVLRNVADPGEQHLQRRRHLAAVSASLR